MVELTYDYLATRVCVHAEENYDGAIMVIKLWNSGKDLWNHSALDNVENLMVSSTLT
jgi:hypothetical protein